VSGIWHPVFTFAAFKQKIILEQLKCYISNNHKGKK
jgi:hypothetical protein